MSTTGPTTLPLAAGAADTALADPLLLGLLDYFAWWLNRDLNAKLANMTGQLDVAVPPAARYPYNPEQGFVQNPIPALYMWRSPDGPKVEAFSIGGTSLLVWPILSMWVLPEQTLPTGAKVLGGLHEAVAASLAHATSQGRHLAYGYNGAPLGTPIHASLNVQKMALMSAPLPFLLMRPGQSSVTATPPRGGDGNIQRGFPCSMATWAVSTLVEATLSGVAPVDSPLSSDHGGETTFGRTLPGEP